MNEPTIDEQIAFINSDDGMERRMADAIFASLERLRDNDKRLDSLPVPVEPEQVTKMRRLSRGPFSEVEWTCIDYIDTLQSALRRVTVERDAVNDVAKDYQTIIEFLAKALNVSYEPHQSFHERIIERAEAAESLNKRMVELLKEVE